MASPSIQKVTKAASLRERIGQSLADAIISGELAPGTMVSVPALAVEFGVSATPVPSRAWCMGGCADAGIAGLRAELDATQARLLELEARLERTDEKVDFTERLNAKSEIP